MKKTDEKNLLKFIDNEDNGMKVMGLSMAKDIPLSEELLPKLLGLYFWSDSSKVRLSSRNLFFKNAPIEYAEIIKKEWQPTIRTLKTENSLTPKLQHLTKSISGTPLASLEVFIPGLLRLNPPQTYWGEDRRKSFIIALRNFGFSEKHEKFLLKLARSKNSLSLDRVILESLSDLGNFQTAIKMSKIRRSNKDGIFSAINKILDKKEYSTQDKTELNVIESWLRNGDQELSFNAYQILARLGKPKIELCKIGITGRLVDFKYARTYILDELSQIEKPESINIILDELDSNMKKSYFRNNTESESLYNALKKLRIYLPKDREEKFKNILLKLLKYELDTHNQRWTEALEILTNYKETKIIDCAIVSFVESSILGVRMGREHRANTFFELLKGFSCQSDDSLLSSIGEWNLDFLKDRITAWQISSPDISRPIYVSLLSITNDFQRLDFFLDNKDFSFPEVVTSSDKTVKKITLTEKEMIMYKKARKSQSKNDISDLFREMVGAHHHLYKNYFSNFDSKDSRKFLFSDDPAIRLMGLSLSKGNNFPDEVKPIIFSIYLFDSDKNVREKVEEIVEEFDLKTIQPPPETEFLYFLSCQSKDIFSQRWITGGLRANSELSGGDYAVTNLVDRIVFLEDERLQPILFKFFDMVSKVAICVHLMDKVKSKYPDKTYEYIVNFLTDQGGLRFNINKYNKSNLVRNSATANKFQLMLKVLPDLVKTKSSFNVGSLIEFMYDLILNCKAEKSTSRHTYSIIKRQLELFEEGTICLSKLDIHLTIEYISKKKMITIPQRTAFAHFLNSLYYLSDDSDVRLRIKELAAPHLKDRSINVRNYLKQIK